MTRPTFTYTTTIRIGYTPSCMPQQDQEALALALAEARAAHGRLVATIEQRMRDLRDLWRTAKPTDRLLAVQRLMQTGGLPTDVIADIGAKNDRARKRLSLARTARKRLERLLAEGSIEVRAHSDLKHTVLRLELDAQLAEQERDEYLDAKDLRGTLYFCSETFVHPEPFGADEAPLKDLAPRAKALEGLIQDLERRASRVGARFTTTTEDGREETLIRMLAPVSLEGDPVQ
jgi:hypothetical protein